MYDEGGRMSVQIASAQLVRNSDGYFGYFGSYTVDESAATVTHHVEAGSAPGFDGTDQRRLFQMQGDHLVLNTPPDAVGVIHTATWERLRV
jgi:hypothetical protein